MAIRIPLLIFPSLRFPIRLLRTAKKAAHVSP
jgi:hypothetical protein